MNNRTNRILYGDRKSYKTVIVTCVVAFVIGLVVYIGIPYEVCHALNPVTFWQKTAVLAEIAIYESIVIPLGMMAIGGIIAVFT